LCTSNEEFEKQCFFVKEKKKFETSVKKKNFLSVSKYTDV